MIQLFNRDCLEAMREMPDKCFDLSIVDPPYFEGPQKPDYYKGTKQKAKTGKYKTLVNSWSLPDAEYFAELKRISENQIVWGINYFDVSLPGGRIVWVKGLENSPFSMCDIAYQSFYNRIDLYKYLWSGYWQGDMKNKEERIHPTQKPVKLYEWLLTNYAKPGDKILDTHLGSGSIAIACHNLGYDLTAFEIDKEYFEAASKRLARHQAEPPLFELRIEPVTKQEELF